MIKITIAQSGIELGAVEADDKETALADVAEELMHLEGDSFTLRIEDSEAEEPPSKRAKGRKA